MTTGATGQLGLALPVQGELSGTWGDTVNNGITQYTNIAIAGTLTLTGDGAVTLANTTGDASASNITSTLAGAGTVTAQFAIVRVTGTLTVAKVVTGPSYSKTYTVVNAATGGIVTFKASGQTGVSVAVGETAFVYFNGTDYVKIVGTATAGAAGGSNTQVQFNSSGVLAGSANLTFNGTTLVANDITDSSLTSGRVTYAGASGNLIDSANLLYSGTDLTVYGVTVGRGASAVASNTAVGASALAANTTGKDGVAIGNLALRDNTTGIANLAIGSLAMITNTTGGYNTAIGNGESGVSQGALGLNTTGSNNTGVGYQALRFNTTASNNVAVGYQAAYTNTTGALNVAVGTRALQLNSTSSDNTAVGYEAAQATTGAANTAMGKQTLASNTSGANNTAVGAGALISNTTGGSTTAVGYQAGYSNNATANVYVGVKAGFSNTSGGANTFVGGSSDSFCGYSNTTGSQNSAFGTDALAGNTTGIYNTAIGYQAGYANTTGQYNTSVGGLALKANTTGSNNSAFGLGSLFSNTTGAGNTAYGRESLNQNTTASNNTAVGYQAGYSFTAPSSGTEGNCTFIGRLAGYSVTTGYSNTFIGQSAGYAVTTGIKNTILGTFDGNQGGLDIRTASNYIVLSDGDGNPRGVFNGSGNLIVGATATISSERLNVTSAGTSLGIYNKYTSSPNNSSNEFFYCNDSTTVRMSVMSNGGISNYAANNVILSDRREKTNFAPATSYLDKICAIPVQTFNYIDQNLEQDGGLTLGVVAQDVQAVAPELVTESNWAGKDDEPKIRLSIYQTDLQYALMKCIQEQQAIIESLKARLDAANL
jgi:hypothetical protein